MRSFDRALRMLECRARAFPHAARYGARVRVDGRTADRDPRELERSGLDGFRTWDWDRLLRHSYVVFTLVTAAVIAAGSSYSPSGLDGRAYWLSDLEHLYTRGPGNDLAFLYSPAFAQLVAPFTGLPWSIFLAALTTASLAALWYLLGPWALPALFLFPVSLELLGANINLLLAAAIVAGFRHPWAWSLVLLTKVTPGIGLVWFAVAGVGLAGDRVRVDDSHRRRVSLGCAAALGRMVRIPPDDSPRISPWSHPTLSSPANLAPAGCSSCRGVWGADRSPPNGPGSCGNRATGDLGLDHRTWRGPSR